MEGERRREIYNFMFENVGSIVPNRPIQEKLLIVMNVNIQMFLTKSIFNTPKIPVNREHSEVETLIT